MRGAVSLFLLLFLSGCATGNYAPVVDIYGQSSRQPNKVTSGSHKVRKGETLYAIAWRFGWDYRALARANHIAPPYTIYPGQVISLAGKSPASSTPSRASRHHSPRTVSHSKPARKAASPPAPVASKPSSSVATSGPLQWHWPASGKVVESYSSNSHGQKGIAISGRHGAPVIAAAPGTVVYRGSGLTGYGNLVIIKHNDRWLSAYAHNDKMLVKEGQSVTGGQQIATMGASGTYRTQLHFEIRRDGKPVNPLHYLPKR